MTTKPLHSNLRNVADSRLFCVLLSMMVAVFAVCPLWAAGPTINGSVYGGGQLAKVTGNTTIEVIEGMVRDTVFGGGLGAVTEVSGTAQVDVLGGEIQHDVYGGSALGSVNTSVVNLLGGQLQNAYGGGLGSATVAALVTGDATVTLGKLQDKADPSDPDIYTSSIVTGSIFGGNNLNGTPQGHIKVHVLSTTPRDGQTAEQFDVAAVYGGGNQAAYVPSEATFTANKGYAEVLIENCNNSIEYVYGGGNAAPVPATQVTIYGANAIGNAFAGGNGKTEDGQPKNPGADVGYNGYYSQTGAETPTYGPGTTNLTIYGGTVHAVFGGSNTLGYIRTQANVTVNNDEELIACAETEIDEIYGGGNMAPMECPSVLTLECAKGLKEVYGGAKAVDVKNNITLNIRSGSYEKVFGGNNISGNIHGSITVNIEETGCYPIKIGSLYGGGNQAQYSAYGYNDNGTPKTEGEKVLGPTINLLSFTSIDNIFGGGYGETAIVYADPVVNVDIDPETTKACAINNVYGGGEDAATFGDPMLNLANGTVNVNAYAGGKGEMAVVTGNPTARLQGATVVGNIFGGGDAAPVEGNPSVVANFGAVANIFAGGKGETAIVTGNPSATIDLTAEKTLAVNNVYGGGDEAQTTGNPALNLMNGTIGVNAYAGGRGESAVVTGDPKAYLQGATVAGNIFGGGDAAPVEGNPGVDAASGMATNIFGGGKGATAIVTGNPKVTIGVEDTETELTVTEDIYGGGDAAAVVGTPWVHVFNDCSVVLNNIYGGGNAANVSATSVEIDGGVINGMVFGGGHGDKSAGISADVTDPDGYVTVFVAGGTINQLFGGSNQKGEIRGQVQIKVLKGAEDDACPMHIGELYGGGNEASGNAGHIAILTTGNKAVGEGIGDVYGGARNADVTSDISLSINGGSIDRVFGGNNMGGAISGAITVTLEDAPLSGDLYVGDVFGGGNKADYAGSPVVTIKKGTVSGNVYGGGALADVTGSTTVNLNGGSVGGAYGGGLGAKIGVDGATEDVEAIVGGNTLVTLNGSVVTGDGVFGANNVNGTPRGHVMVHVLSTHSNGGEYHVPAVYGGGNKAAYIPTAPDGYAEVLIENCDNSIEYVYGGGNAAPVPAASVTIYGANAIGYAFAGGNGAGLGNPGADIGYLGYYSSGAATEYGLGTAELLIYGGTVLNAFGGSNTLGYIRTKTRVVVDDDNDYTGIHCPLDVKDIHGGGNEAELYCPTEVELGCSEGAEVIYGGSRSADIFGDVKMTIRSGSYGKVFGGNNESGNIYGKLEVNIDETGCYPVRIDTLYVGGNKAAYSVYGYYKDGDPDATVDNIGKPRTEGTQLYDDPTINIISFTKIGTVFGGGLGESATIYCDTTHINVEPIPGLFAVKIDANNDGEVDNNADAVGAIGTIYGGGNAGAVYGNTEVKIGTKATNKHVSGDDKETEKEVVVNITNDVFGGGNKAIVSGDTHVTIGQ